MFLAKNFQGILFMFMQLAHLQLMSHADVMWRIARLLAQNKPKNHPQFISLQHFNWFYKRRG